MIDESGPQTGICRRSVIRAMLVGGVGAVFGPLSPSVAFAMSRTPAQGVQTTEGVVRINGSPARKGARIRAGDTVTTGKDGKAVIVAGADVFLIRGDSEIRFDSPESVEDDLLPDGKRGLAVRAFTMVTGAMLAVFGPGEKRLNTPFASIGIRGSGAYYEIFPDKAYFCLCYGKASLISTSQPESTESINTTHHESPFWIHGTKDRQAFEKAPVINHTDAELVGLEAYVFRKPPFVDQPDGSGY